MSLLASLIAKREGFGIPGALPTRQNNPGDLMHAPGEIHPANAPNSIGSFDSIEAGWAALERQLQLFAARRIQPDNHLMTIQDMVYVYAPPSSNDTADYLNFVCEGLGCGPNTTVADALAIQSPTTGALA